MQLLSIDNLHRLGSIWVCHPKAISVHLTDEAAGFDTAQFSRDTVSSRYA